jgi:hypothetical protein
MLAKPYIYIPEGAEQVHLALWMKPAGNQQVIYLDSLLLTFLFTMPRCLRLIYGYSG